MEHVLNLADANMQRLVVTFLDLIEKRRLGVFAYPTSTNIADHMWDEKRSQKCSRSLSLVLSECAVRFIARGDPALTTQQQPLLNRLDLQRQIFRIDAALRETAGDEP
jgi:hypothetical protein